MKKVALTCWLVWWLLEEKHSINAEQKKKEKKPVKGGKEALASLFQMFLACMK